MAKKRTSPQSAEDLPGVGAATQTVSVRSSVLTCSVPYIDSLHGYKRRRVDIRLTGNQAEKLKGILMGLEAKDAQLENGRYVTSPVHAIQWIIENAS